MKEQRKVDNKLWVDKYRPNHITELLGDATVQRLILHLFRSWKQLLQSPPTTIHPEPLVSKRKASKALDESKNTLIVWGPPGIGKTTAIPMLLRHVGFQVHYISAAEENSWEYLFSRIEALRNKSCMFSNSSTSCIVIDDVVFTAGQTQVDKCIKILVDNAKRGFPSEAESFKNGVFVVVICEDAYSKGLATLRSFASVVYFQESDTKSLIFRTMNILKKEQLKDHNIPEQETECMKELCETAAGDIRWVMNQLQYLHSHFQYFPSAHQHMQDFKDLSRSNMVDIMKHVFTSQAKEGQLSDGYFHSLSVAEYHSLLDICPTIAIAAVETGDDLKQLTEILDWQFALYNLSHLPCNETESIVKDVGASIVKEYAQLGKKVNSMNYFHEKRMERQKIQNSVATIQELRNSWISSFARFDTTQSVAQVYPLLTCFIYYSIVNASKLTDTKRRIEAVKMISKICRCYRISVTWDSKSLLEEGMETDRKSWNFVPALSNMSYLEDASSSSQTQSPSFLETLSTLIGILENPERNLEYPTNDKENHYSFVRESLERKDRELETSICFRFHEGHSNAILKPVTIDMLSSFQK